MSSPPQAMYPRAELNTYAFGHSVGKDEVTAFGWQFFESLEIGVLLVERRDAKQGAVMRAWMDTHVMPPFAGRVLPVDIAVALECARLYVPAPSGERDALIAATALVHGMTIVTRNFADFDSTGVPIFDPWGARAR